MNVLNDRRHKLLAQAAETTILQGQLDHMPRERARGDFLIPNAMPQNIYREHISRYEFAASLTRNKVVLDIACGAGYGSSFLKKKGAKMVVGGDVNRDAVEYAKEHYKGEELVFLRLDAMNLPFSKSTFDVIVSFETIEHLKDNRRFLSACKEVLKKSGLFICSTPNSLVTLSDLGRPLNPFHVHEFTVKEFFDLLSEYFRYVNIYVQDFLTLRQIIMYKLYGSGTRFLSLTFMGRKIRDIIWEKSMNLKNLMWKKKAMASSSFLSIKKPLCARYRVKPFKNNRTRLLRVAHIIAISKK